MSPVTRLRAYRGLWLLVGLLGLALVFLAAGAGPVDRHNQDRAVRFVVGQAPMPARDLLASEPVTAPDAASSAARVRASLAGLLPEELAGVVGTDWGIQRTQLERPSTRNPTGLAASLTGDGISTEPSGVMPLVTLHHQTDQDAEIRLVAGSAPVSDPATASIEVMVATAVLEGLGLRTGEVYHLLPGIGGVFPLPPDDVDGPVVAVRVAGVFEPRDPAAAGWELDPRLLSTGHRLWPVADQLAPVQVATLMTDQAGIDVLRELGLDPVLGTENVARVRLDESRLDAAWVEPGRAAVEELLSTPKRSELRVGTGLLELLDEYQRQAVAARAVTAVVLAGLVGTGIGLLLLAARVTVDRRQTEVALLRARGASSSTMVGRFLRESLLVIVPAAATGWLLHLLLPGRPDPGRLLGIGALPLAVAVVALVAVPLTAGWAGRHTRSAPPRRDLARHRAAPARLTVELAVVLLAALGVLLLHQRGRTGVTAATGDTDPYLSAVPVLIGVAAGLLALRLCPGPLRVLGRLAARRRGVVGFLGLARAGRAAPATALPLLVLVLAVAVGGFAGTVYASVTAARDAAALREVGADVRIITGGELTDDAVAEVAGLPGVVTVAGVTRDGALRIGGSTAQNVTVLAIDAPAYQQVLAAVEAPGRLPERIVAAGPGGGGPVPILGRLPETDLALTVLAGGVEQPVELTGDLDDLPALVGGPWVLVPRQALAEPPPYDELLVAGGGADPVAIQDAVARTAGVDPAETTVTTLAGQRADLETAGFNQALTLAFVVGSGGAAVGGLLAVGLALVTQAAARGRALSLLRTMGLSAGQARGLLLVELVPVAALAVAVGAAAGTAMPVVLAPALGLTEFTGGGALPLALSPATVALLAGLLAVFVIGGALAEAAVHRRLGLGQVLRVE